ncbi:MAG: DUF309 domain-containing protein [Candidatus Sumerlaeia bacterium]|nr:DUF309 domain-containing protein [Candidatus Sumerlaeia bacterium]
MTRTLDPAGYPREYLAFMEQFNAGAFFEAHEVLEDLWVVEVPPLREYYKGLIMAAVAVCHWQRGRPSPAWRLWRDARPRLAAVPKRFEGFDVHGFIAAMDALFEPIRDGRDEAWTPAMSPLIPRLQVDPAHSAAGAGGSAAGAGGSPGTGAAEAGASSDAGAADASGNREMRSTETVHSKPSDFPKQT